MIYTSVMVCKTCKQEKESTQFSQIKRKNSITYRQSCKSCEYDKSLARKNARGGVEASQSTTPETDPAFFKSDEYAKMPSDSDMLFWSTDYFEVATEGRKTLRNPIPEDK